MPFSFQQWPQPAPLWSRLLGWLPVMLFAVSLLLGEGARADVAAQDLRLSVHPESKFWIQGKATTHDFTCRVHRVEGEAVLPPAPNELSSSETPSPDEERQTDVTVRVPVRAFDCGRSRMTKDLQETLKMEAHPQIRFELIDASVGAPTDTSGRWRRIRVLGALTIAGTKRLVNLEAKGHALDERRFRVRGCRSILMTDFNIEPPTKAFGLIKVKDRVEVQFDLFAHSEKIDSGAAFEHISVSEPPSCQK